MTLAFILSMPGRASWNGRWSGEETLYALTRKFSTQKAQLKATSLLGRHYYRWSDGWCACVEVKAIEGKDLRNLRKRSRGFCGYDWMVDGLIQHGAIYASHDEIPTKEEPVTV